MCVSDASQTSGTNIVVDRMPREGLLPFVEMLARGETDVDRSFEDCRITTYDWISNGTADGVDNSGVSRPTNWRRGLSDLVLYQLTNFEAQGRDVACPAAQPNPDRERHGH